MKNKHKGVHKPDDKEQSRLFVEKARELGADQDEGDADKLMDRLAKMPPEPRTKKNGNG